jgi:hypothetical protein
VHAAPRWTHYRHLWIEIATIVVAAALTFQLQTLADFI